MSNDNSNNPKSSTTGDLFSNPSQLLDSLEGLKSTPSTSNGLELIRFGEDEVLVACLSISGVLPVNIKWLDSPRGYVEFHDTIMRAAGMKPDKRLLWPLYEIGCGDECPLKVALVSLGSGKGALLTLLQQTISEHKNELERTVLRITRDNKNRYHVEAEVRPKPTPIDIDAITPHIEALQKDINYLKTALEACTTEDLLDNTDIKSKLLARQREDIIAEFQRKL